MYIVYGYELELCRLHLTHSDVASNLSSGALLTPEFWRAEVRSRRPIAW